MILYKIDPKIRSQFKFGIDIITEGNICPLDFPTLLIRGQQKELHYYFYKKLFENPQEIDFNQFLHRFQNKKSLHIFLIADLLKTQRYKHAAKAINYYRLTPEDLFYIEDKDFDHSILELVNEKEEHIFDFPKDEFAPVLEGAFQMPCQCEDVIIVNDEQTVQLAYVLLDEKIVYIYIYIVFIIYIIDWIRHRR